MKKRCAVLFALILSVLFSGCGFIYEREYYKARDFAALGTYDIEVWLLGRDSPAVYQTMLAELDSINSDINLNSDSPLKYLNDQAVAGEAVEFGEHSFNLYNLSLDYYKKTGGAFHIAMQPFSELWRIDSASQGNHYRYLGPSNFDLPDYQDILAAKETLDVFAETETPFGITAYKQDDKYYFKKLADGIKIDFGAIAKGYAVQTCMDIAIAAGSDSAYVGIAGHNKIYGKYHSAETDEDTMWHNPITNPRSHGMRGSPLKRELFIMQLSGEASSIVSGDYERYYYWGTTPSLFGTENDDSIPVCHIINPSSGMPIGISYNQETKRYEYDPDTVISVVIFDPSANTAETYATAGCVYSFESAKQLLLDARIRGVVLTERNIAFIGISETDFYLSADPYYNTYQSYDEVEFIALS